MDERIERLRALSNAASPGPWRPSKDGYHVWGPVPGFGDIMIAAGLDMEDAEFIAAAREAVPWLLEELVKAQAENERLRKERDTYKAALQNRHESEV